MNTPTYKEQFDKITTAYINGKLNPYSNCACFIGNMFGNKGSWSDIRCGYGIELLIGKSIDSKRGRNYDQSVSFINTESNNFYSAQDIINLENNFLATLMEETFDLRQNGFSEWMTSTIVKNHTNYENALALAMESTLDMLKQIHISKGEVIDEKIVFVKRELEVA